MNRIFIYEHPYLMEVPEAERILQNPALCSHSAENIENGTAEGIKLYRNRVSFDDEDLRAPKKASVERTFATG